MKRWSAKFGCLIITLGLLFELAVLKTSSEKQAATDEDTGVLYSYVDYPFNTTVSRREFTRDNVLDFINNVNKSISTIQTYLNSQLEMVEPSLVNVTKKSNKDVILFTFFAVQGLIDQAREDMEALLEKISLTAIERKITLSGSNLMLTRDNRTFENGWLEYKSREIAEFASILYVNHRKLTKFYEMHSKFLPMFTKSLAVAAFHNLNEECKPPVCPKFNSWFTCESGDQVLPCNKYCNGHFECKDKSDEPPGCSHPFLKTCSPEEYRCDDGKQCISYLSCKYLNACQDRSHTNYCDTKRKYFL